MDQNIKKLSIRRAEIFDLDMLLRWRNHPKTRAASRNSGKITPAEHEKWFMESLKNPERQIFITEEEGVPVGTVRVDRLKGICELSWTVSPEHTGRGIGKWMVKKIANQIKGPLKAEIKTDNHASRKIAEIAGLTKKSAKNDMIHFYRNSMES